MDDRVMVFAAGDFGGRLGLQESEGSTATLSGAAHTLTAVNTSIWSLLPNARLTQLSGLGREATQAIEPSGFESLAWSAAFNGKTVQETLLGVPTLAVPLRAPLLPGYPGVLLATRSEGSAFTARDIQAITAQAEGRDARAAHRSADGACGIILLDSKGRLLNSHRGCTLDELDPKIRSGLLEDAKVRMGRRPKRVATRIRLRDGHGAYQNFRVELLKDLPLIDGAPVLAYTLPPRVGDWAALEESHFAGNPDVQRLIPALKFMIHKFAALPGLPQIAQKARLSPFHFHRQFSALLGISPKHLMLDCQIELACGQLRRGDVELVQIARSCGFAHQSHFTSRFKQATGLTPTGWRKAMRSAD